MPCKHAVAAINDMGSNGLVVAIPETWVHSSYWLKTWQQMYSYKISCVNGPEHWPNYQALIKLLPPVHHPQIGRPQKKRRKSVIEAEEMVKQGGKLSRVGKTVRCMLCKELGHNKRSCKGQKMGPNPAAPNKKRKPAATNQLLHIHHLQEHLKVLS